MGDELFHFHGYQKGRERPNWNWSSIYETRKWNKIDIQTKKIKNKFKNALNYTQVFLNKNVSNAVLKDDREEALVYCVVLLSSLL